MAKLQAAIFDLDGTLLDNNEVHLRAWKHYLKEIRMEISDEDFKKNISGRTNKDATEHLFDKKMTEEEAAQYYLQKEKIYRHMYEEDIEPIAGLQDILQALKDHKIDMAIATSGIQVNIDFMFQHVPIKHYFKKVINSSHISKGKPDPEIFIKTAEALNIPSANCIVFEDSMAGVQAAQAAGMKVIALTTSHSKEELKHADLVIKDYTEVSFDIVESLL